MNIKHEIAIWTLVAIQSVVTGYLIAQLIVSYL